MTYTLFQSIQEQLAELIEEQPESIVDIASQTSKLSIGDCKEQVNYYNLNSINIYFINNYQNVQEETSKKPKKEQLTKSQKRRQWNRTDGKGEKPRGFDWVDIVKHLSQTGSKPEQET